MLGLEWKGIWNSDSLDFRRSAFGTTPQLSEIQTGHPHHDTTFKYYLLSTFLSSLWGRREGGSILKRIALNVVRIVLHNYPFLFQCLKSKLLVRFRFLRVQISDRKKCLRSKLSGNETQLNCLKSKLVWISDIHCKQWMNKYWTSLVF